MRGTVSLKSHDSRGVSSAHTRSSLTPNCQRRKSTGIPDSRVTSALSHELQWARSLLSREYYAIASAFTGGMRLLLVFRVRRALAACAGRPAKHASNAGRSPHRVASRFQPHLLLQLPKASHDTSAHLRPHRLGHLPPQLSRVRLERLQRSSSHRRPRRVALSEVYLSLPVVISGYWSSCAIARHRRRRYSLLTSGPEALDLCYSPIDGSPIDGTQTCSTKCVHR